jgi:hypothetical protein
LPLSSCGRDVAVLFSPFSRAGANRADSGGRTETPNLMREGRKHLARHDFGPSVSIRAGSGRSLRLTYPRRARNSRLRAAPGGRSGALRGPIRPRRRHSRPSPSIFRVCGGLGTGASSALQLQPNAGLKRDPRGHEHRAHPSLTAVPSIQLVTNPRLLQQLMKSVRARTETVPALLVSGSLRERTSLAPISRLCGCSGPCGCR